MHLYDSHHNIFLCMTVLFWAVFSVISQELLLLQAQIRTTKQYVCGRCLPSHSSKFPKCLLNTYRHGESTTSLGRLSQHLITLTVKSFFLTFRQNPFPGTALCCSLVSSHPITSYRGEEISTSLSISPTQEVVESNEFASQPSFIQTRQTKCPPPLLIRHALQPF